MVRSNKPRSGAAPCQQQLRRAVPYTKLHVCPRCTAAFGTASKLTIHVRAVHEKRRDHACPQCAAAFGTACKLTMHVRTMHPDNSLQGEVDSPPVPEAAAVTLSADHILAALLAC